MLRKWSVHRRSLLSILSAGLVGSFLPSWLHWATRILCIWNTGMICFLGLTWWTMIQATPMTMRRIAQQQNIVIKEGLDLIAQKVIGCTFERR
jgi:uncharacterized membrane protein